MQTSDLVAARDGPSPLHAARALAGGILDTLRLSRALLEARRAVDLAGLEAAVGLLCAKALDVEPAEGQSLTPDLAAVLAELAMLADALAGSAEAAADA